MKTVEYLVNGPTIFSLANLYTSKIIVNTKTVFDLSTISLFLRLYLAMLLLPVFDLI